MFSMHSKKCSQSDRQLLSKACKKFSLIFLVLLMFDTLFDWLLGLIDLMLEGMHIIIEALEYSIEVLLELIFQTNQQQSEIIIVNVTAIISLYLAYRIFRALPAFYSYLKNRLFGYIDHRYNDWHETPIICKMKIIAIYSIGTSIVLFFVTL